jgi:hypothetical protein
MRGLVGRAAPDVLRQAVPFILYEDDGQVGCQVDEYEYHKKHLEQAKKGLHDCDVGRAVDVKPSVLDSVN